MASVTDNRPADSSSVQVDPAQEHFVDAQIRRTRRALKIVDFTAGVITLLIGVLASLLVLAVIEHWIVPGGWGPISRGVIFAMLVVAIGWYCWRYFWPLLSKPINPAFAAKTIEQSSPSLKNSLLNFLLLRQRRLQISRQVYQAIEQQAAQRLAQVPLDTVIDRSSILKLGYVLVGVVALCALYRVLSPKDPLASAGRLLMPWSDIAVPSRVRILDVKPGDTSAARGEQLAVTAEILGAFEDEPVRLRYSANDQQVVDQEVLMTAQEGGLRYEGRLPGRVAMGGGSGIQTDLTYWIEAGDACSAKYKVTVFSQPTLVVEKIRYEYPIYTRYEPREVGNTGDVSAVEGTIVTITAVANHPIETAHVDFDADGRHDLLMKAEGQKATVSFPLELTTDRRTPRYSSYVLRYTTAEGRKNSSPPKYRIDVQQDYSPEIELLAPEAEMLDVGLREEVVIEVEARDPDFAVHNVAILGEVAGERVLKKSLLSRDHTGRFTGQIKLVPEELNLKPGDVLEYWGAAADSRRPEPNLAFTRHQKLRVLGRPDLSGGQEQSDQGQDQSDQGSEQQSEGGEQGENGQAGGGGQGQQDESGQQQGGEGGQGGEGQPNDAPGEGGQQSGEQGASGESNNESNGGSQGEAGGESPSEGEQKSGEQQSGKPGDQNPGGQQSAGEGKVSPEGDNDGEAFDRIAKHFEEKGGQQGESQGAEGESHEQQGNLQQGEDSSGNQSGNKNAGEQSDTGESGQSQGEQPGDQQGQQPGEQQGQQSGDQQGEQQRQPPGDQQDQQRGEQQGEQQGEKEGAEGSEAAPQESREDQEKADGQGESNDAGGEMEENQGPAGAGDNPGQEQGAPNPAGDTKPNDKPTDEAGKPQQNDQEAPMEGQQKRESDSQGGQGGDRTGGGQEGGGQKADEEGTGGAGEHQAADEGGSAAEEQGQGETGSKAGGDQEAGGETGKSSGDQPGQGGEQGDQAGQQPGGKQSSSDKSQQGEQPSDPSSAGGNPQAGGTGGNSSAPPPTGETEAGDQANLEYARKQTDLVINKLDDQLRKQEVDKELLDKLGWTADELRRFVERWKSLKAQADGGGPQAEEAQLELNDALRSLGLGQKEGPRFQSQSAKDKLRDLQNAYRVRTPMEYQDRMRKYIKGTATPQEE